MKSQLGLLLTAMIVLVVALSVQPIQAQEPQSFTAQGNQPQATTACPPDFQFGCAVSGTGSNGLLVSNAATTANATALYGRMTATSGNATAAGVRGYNSSSTNAGYGVWGTHAGSGIAVFGETSNGLGVVGRSLAGIGVRGLHSTTGGTGAGVEGQTSSTGAGPGVLGIHSATSGTGAGVEGRTNSNDISATGVLGVVNSTQSGDAAAGVRGINNTLYGYGVWGEGYVGVVGQSNNGYGVQGFSYSDGLAGVYGSASSTTGSGVSGVASGSSGKGVYGSANGANAVGVYGFNPRGAGVSGSSTSSTGVSGSSTSGSGVTGATNSSGAAGVYGTNASGRGVWGAGGTYGVYGETSQAAGRGVSGVTSGSGSYGVYGSSPHIGVYGDSPNIGVIGYGITGVRGISTSSSGIGLEGAGFHGVLGTTDGTQNSVGVRGTNYSSNSNTVGWAGYFDGRVGVVGNLSKGGGSFLIDHPLDPENRTLSHSFVESPDMMNVYNGNVTLDANGEAEVVLPDYFEALNRDFRYQLTAIGAPGPNLYIAETVKNNRFRIVGGSGAMQVSWQVTGIRQDPYANANRIVVEENKPTNERGLFLYPEAYGQPEERGVNYAEQQRMEERQQMDAPAQLEAPTEAPL